MSFNCKKLVGLGRKIKLSTKISQLDKHSSSTVNMKLIEEHTYFEEGEFKNDQLDDTFGRVVKLNGTYRIGWFQGNCDFLHGYGLKVDSKSKIEGLFERGERKEKE